MKLRKRVAILLALVLLSLTACGKSKWNTYMVLVNKQNPLPSDWTEDVTLETAKNIYDEECLVEKETLKQFQLLRADLLKERIHIEIDSAYRSVEEQQAIWDEWSADPEYGEEYCKKYLAAPGYSEHHTGLAIDIFLIKNGNDVRDNDAMLAETEVFEIIHQRLPEYGFILRYPEGKEDVTGYNYEPWHFRYVGSKVIAKMLTDKEITLEEYFE